MLHVFNVESLWEHETNFTRLCSTFNARISNFSLIKTGRTRDGWLASLAWIRSLFHNVPKGLDNRLIRLCKRASYIIHGHKLCGDCNLSSVFDRRVKLSMRLFLQEKSDDRQVLQYYSAECLSSYQEIVSWEIVSFHTLGILAESMDSCFIVLNATMKHCNFFDLYIR